MNASKSETRSYTDAQVRAIVDAAMLTAERKDRRIWELEQQVDALRRDLSEFTHPTGMLSPANTAE